MGDLVPLRLTRNKILREARREINRMYRLSHGGQDPIPNVYALYCPHSQGV